jgi:hypothetical protein
MTCTCGANICYICRNDITVEKYKHFCQTPHCTHEKCGKCLLYTNAVEDDRKAMLEAGVKTMQENNGIDGNNDNINNNNNAMKSIVKSNVSSIVIIIIIYLYSH